MVVVEGLLVEGLVVVAVVDQLVLELEFRWRWVRESVFRWR